LVDLARDRKVSGLFLSAPGLAGRRPPPMAGGHRCPVRRQGCRRGVAEDGRCAGAPVAPTI